MTNDTEPRVRDALAALAQRGGAPDEAAAWQRVAAAIDADRRSSGRRRAVLATAGLALVGSAAAVLALVVADDEPRQSVRVVAPATEPSTPPTVTVAPTTPAPPVTDPPTMHTGPTVVDPPADPAELDVTPAAGPVPAHPVAVIVGADGAPAHIEVYDGDTGELLARPVEPSWFSYEDVSFGPDGALWFAEEFGDTHAVTRVAWGSTTKETPVGTESSEPAVSPDGTTLAYVHAGVTVERWSVRLVDLRTGEQVAELTWRDDDPDFFHTQGSITHMEWSPDGQRLLLVSSYEGSEVLVLDPASATSLSDATPLVANDAWDAHWAGPDRVVLLDRCCYPDHENREVQVHDLATGDVSVPEIAGTAVAVDAAPDGTVAVLTDDGVLHFLDGRTVDVPGALDVGM